MINASKKKEMIRVLIVEDCKITSKLLFSILNSVPDIEVIGIAKDGDMAIQMTKKLKPDLITMDVILPKKNGLEVTQHIMAFMPTPILVISSSDLFKEIDLTFNAISLGALDVIEKNNLNGKQGLKFQNELLEKVRLLSRVQVIRHPLGRINKKLVLRKKPKKDSIFLVGIAASTGGPKAIYPLLENLPTSFDFAIIIIQHIVPSFCLSFVEWLKNKTNRNISMAKHRQFPEANNIYIAPADKHLQIAKDGKIVLNSDPPYKKYKPSADKLFKSLAENAPNNSMGVILSGMGNDGFEGLKKMNGKKIPVIAQNEMSCVVYGMPKVCIDAGIVNSVAAPKTLSNEIMFFYSNWKGDLNG